MTAIGAVATRDERPDVEALSEPLLAAGWRWGGNMEHWSGSRCALRAATFDWEREELDSTPRLGSCAGFTVAVDGVLYYRRDLCRALGVARLSPGEGDAWLVARALEAWGPECISRLEGDFAFVAWDSRDQRLILARDHVGRRPLHYAVRPGAVLASSQARLIARHPLVGSPVNQPAVAAAISALLGGSRETGFEGVFPVPAAGTLVWTPRTGMQEGPRWEAPSFRVGGKPNLREGGEALRSLIADAVAERMPTEGTASVWLSGGADSPAVAVGAVMARNRGATRARVAPVTMSYPEGDMGREDHYVSAIAAELGLQVSWLESEGVSAIESVGEWVAHRDDPYAHTFEGMNRALCARSRQLGARVVLDGYGGDQLFGISKSYLADLLVRGRIGELMRELDGYGDRGWRAVVRHAVMPWLPEGARYRLARMRGRTDDEASWQALAPWLTAAWRSDPSLRWRLKREPSRRMLESPSAYESRWYVETPYFPRAIAWATGIALQSGVELRSPLLDRRILEFAASRPVSERGIAGQPKPLLREAMRGLLPDSVLAPRTSKTGTPGGQFQRRMRREIPEVVASMGQADSWLLVTGGIADRDALKSALAAMDTMSHIGFVQLYLSVSAEYWLRANC